MNRVIVAVLLMTASGLLRADVEVTFKGVLFGVSETAFTEKNPGFRCRTTDIRFKASSDRNCTVYGKPEHNYQRPKLEAGTFAGVAANIDAAFFEDKLASVHVYVFATDFEDVLRALLDRFGKPDSLENMIVKNRMGAEFQNVVALWKRGDVILKAERFGSDLTESLVSYQTTWGIEEFKKRRDPQRGKAASDM